MWPNKIGSQIRWWKDLDFQFPFLLLFRINIYIFFNLIIKKSAKHINCAQIKCLGIIFTSKLFFFFHLMLVS